MKRRQDFKDFALLTTALGENCGKEPSKEKIELFFRYLSDFSIEQVKKAVDYILGNEEYSVFPTIAKIRHAIEGTCSDRALIAWKQVVKAMEDIGVYESIKFSDTVIHSCIETMGGWQRLCATELDDLQWREKEFLQLYQALSRNRVKSLPYLPGLHEINNRLRGYIKDIKPPLEIGFEDKKQLENKSVTKKSPKSHGV